MLLDFHGIFAVKWILSSRNQRGALGWVPQGLAPSICSPALNGPQWVPELKWPQIGARNSLCNLILNRIKAKMGRKRLERGFYVDKNTELGSKLSFSLWSTFFRED